MHPDRLIVHTYRRSNGLSTKTDYHKTFTCQFSNTNNATRKPPFTVLWYEILPILWIHYTYLFVYDYAYGPMRLFCHHDHHKHHTSMSRACPSSYQVSNGIAIIGIRSSVMSDVSNCIRLTCFYIWLDSIMVSIWLYSIFFNPIIITSNVFIFDLSHKIWITFQSGLEVSHIV